MNLEARVLALETIVRTLVSELAALWSEEGKGSPDWIIDKIVASSGDDVHNLATDERQAQAEVLACHRRPASPKGNKMNIHVIRCQQQQKTNSLPPTTYEQQLFGIQSSINGRGLAIIQDLVCLLKSSIRRSTRTRTLEEIQSCCANIR